MNRTKPIFAFSILLLIGVPAIMSCADRDEIEFFTEKELEEMRASWAAKSSSSFEVSSSSEEQSSSSIDAISSSNELPSSSSEVESSSSSSAQSSSSVETSSSSAELSSSSVEQSSSSTDAISSSSVVPSSSSAEPVVSLSCTGLVPSAYATRPVAKPTLVCSNGADATGITWVASSTIDWNSPAAGAYDVNAKATCGTAANLIAPCGELAVSLLPVLTCNAQPKGYVGIAVPQPELSCSSGALKNSSLTGAPVWGSPAIGAYIIGAKADCGDAADITASCGNLNVIEPTLDCNMHIASVFTGAAITKPVPVCSDGSTPSSIFNTVPELNWTAPAASNYSVSVSADCGAGILYANCGILAVELAKLTCGAVPALGTSGTAITPPALTCSNNQVATSAVWTNAPDWSNPAKEEYSGISVAASCGTATGLTADCSGTLTVTHCGDFVDGTPRQHQGKNKSQFCDERDGKKYVYTEIGTQTWMAENLNYNASGSKCGNGSTLSDANTATCDTYGRLYNWATAMNGSASSSANPSGRQGVCPDGWHLPSDAEWTTLSKSAGGTGTYGHEGTAGTKLRATSGWNESDGYIAGTDNYGFSALPGGYGSSSGYFDDVGDVGDWWSSTEDNANYAYYRNMHYNDANVYYYSISVKNCYYSVRCVHD